MRAARVCACVVLVAFAVGCASNRAPSPATCAAIGAVLGGGGGALIGTKNNKHHDGDEAAAIGAAGAVLLGTAGYFICRALAKEEAPPPPEPAPAPPPPPKAEPAPPPPPPPPPPVVREKIVLRGVNFDFDKSEIRPDAAVILDEAVTQLQGQPDARVSIEGHTDWTGTEVYNQGLSERRAEAVRVYLVNKGVDAARLSTVGYGELRPIAGNETREGRALNRRVELKVLGE